MRAKKGLKGLKKVLLSGLVVLSLLANAATGWHLLRKAFPPRVAFLHPEPAYYAAERGHYLANKPKPGGVVFAGDSTMAYPLIHLTRRYVEGGLTGPWRDLFAAGRVVNRSIPGDTIHGLHGRMADVLALAPAKLFVQVGVNDAGSSRTPDQLAAEYAEMLAGAPPGTRVYVIGSLPTRDDRDNGRARAINDAVRSATVGLATYVDLWPTMSEGGRLADRFTFDGVHLTREGADAWQAAITSYVVE